MSWQEEVDKARLRKQQAKLLGGEKAVAKQHARGKLTVRERIDGLIDEGSFHEEGPQAGASEVDDQGRPVGFTPGNYVLGCARIDGRPVVLGGEDFTQRGGSPTPAGLRKSVYSETLALQYRLPLVRFLEGGGGSVRGSGKAAGPPRPVGDPVYNTPRFLSIAKLLRTVPVVSAGVGAVAGFPAARLVASHLALMTRETSQVLIGGPALVERALGEKKTKEELGGPQVHLYNGVVDNLAEDEREIFSLIRRFLGYLPSHVGELPPITTPGSKDAPDRGEERLLDIVPRDRRRLYDMRKIIRLIVDHDSFFERTPLWGRSQITGLARLNGYPVGILANDAHHVGGAMDAAGAQKVRRFVEFCDQFHLPIISLVDEPGFMIGSASENSGTIRYGMEAIAATVLSSVPWASILVRKAYGVAAAAHFGPYGRVYSWPSAETGALPVEGGVAVAYRREIAEAEDPEAKRRELEEQFAAKRSAFPRAESFAVHDLIDPRDTRLELCRFMEHARRMLEVRLAES